MKNLLVLIVIITVIFKLLGVPLITSLILDILVLGLIIIFSWIPNKNKPKKENDVLRNNITENKLTDKMLFVDSDQINENIHSPNNLFIDKMSNIDLSNQTPTDINLKNNKQELLGSIIKDLIVYVNNKDTTDTNISFRTFVKPEHIDLDFQIQDFSEVQKVQMNKNRENELEKKRILGNILNSLIAYKKDKVLTGREVYNNLFVDDDSIIDITDMASYKLDYNDFYPENIPMDEDRVEIERDLYGDKSIDATLPDYSEPPFEFGNEDEELRLTKYSQNVPYWAHTYIYSTNELYYASSSIKNFYAKYKEEFLKGVYINLEGNTNYSFTLLFDFLAEYDTHKNLTLLTHQMQALIKHYQETQSYAESNLIRKAKLSGKRRAICGTTEITVEDLINLFPNSHEWSFLDKFSDQLDLSEKEMGLIEYIGAKWGSFYSPFDFLSIKAVDFFKIVIKEIDRRYHAEGSSIEEEFKKVAGLFDLRNFNRYYDYDISKYINGELSEDEKIKEIYNCIYRLCRNKLLKKHGLDSDIDIYESVKSKDSKSALIEYIMPVVRPVVKESVKQLPELSDEEEIIVNERYNTRWRPIFQKLTDEFNGNLSIFLEDVNILLKQNQNNHGQRYLLFDTAKFLIGKDDITALKMYIKYITAQHKFTDDKEKPLPQYIYKKLFKTTDQRTEFDNIINAYKKDGDISKAYSEIEFFFAPKRKKLNLNTDEISKIAVQHSDTVKLLNQVMEEEQIIIVEQAPMVDEVQSNRTNTSGSSINSILDSEQQELLDIFVENNCILKKSQVEVFAKSKNLMANRLVEKINDLCYESLDDILIEDEDDSWTMQEDYLEKILVR